MSKPDDIELMQHADREPGSEIETALDDTASAKVEALGQMSELVRGHLELAADAVPDHKFAAMWREVDAAISQQAPRGVWARFTSWLDAHRGHVITGALSAGAVAAIALFIRTSSDTKAPERSSIEVLPAAMRTAPVVESLDTPDGTGTVMNFEDEEGHTTVIWVTPADTVEGI